MPDNKELFRGLADNPSLMEALRTLLEAQFSTDTLNRDHSDEVLGQMVRARLVGLQAVEDALKEIAKYKSQPTPAERVAHHR